MRRSTYCDRCQREIPSLGIEIFGSIGMLALVRFRTTRGYFCRECVSAIVRKENALNLTAGLFWWGGLLAGPLLTLANLFPWLASRRLPRPDPDAAPPAIDEMIAARVGDLMPRLTEDIERQTDNLHASAARLASDAHLSPAQIVHVLRLMAEEDLPPPGGRGFEVILQHQPKLAEQPRPTDTADG